jgi:hypothetical protein
MSSHVRQSQHSGQLEAAVRNNSKSLADLPKTIDKIWSSNITVCYLALSFVFDNRVAKVTKLSMLSNRAEIRFNQESILQNFISAKNFSDNFHAQILDQCPHIKLTIQIYLSITDINYGF